MSIVRAIVVASIVSDQNIIPRVCADVAADLKPSVGEK